jgi:hypothetical protein
LKLCEHILICQNFFDKIKLWYFDPHFPFEPPHMPFLGMQSFIFFIVRSKFIKSNHCNIKCKVVVYSLIKSLACVKGPTKQKHISTTNHNYIFPRYFLDKKMFAWRLQVHCKKISTLMSTSHGQRTSNLSSQPLENVKLRLRCL